MAGFLVTGTRKGAWLSSKMGSSRNDSFTKDQRGWRPTSDGLVSIQGLATILIFGPLTWCYASISKPSSNLALALIQLVV